MLYQISSVQSLSHVWLFATPWTTACQASLSITNSQSYSNSCPSSWWCHPTISSSVIPFSFHHQSFPASGSLPMSQFFSSGGQSIGVSASASVLHYNYISCGDLWSTVIFCVTCWYLRHWLFFSNKFLLLINLFFNWRTTTLQNFVFCETSTRIRRRYSHEQ